MKRLAVILLALALLEAPVAVDAQPAGKIHRIAYLGSTPPPPPALLQGLREQGWIEGQNVVIEHRYTQGRPERYPELVAEVLKLPVDVIVVADSQAAWAAKGATSTIPIILAGVADAVRQGLITGLARPGGNITGPDSQLGDIAGKRLGALVNTMPILGRYIPLRERNRSPFTTAGTHCTARSHASGAPSHVGPARCSFASCRTERRAPCPPG
jgi:ABC transporter substrate binding protein